MKKFFTIALCLISLFAFGKCERCKDKGYFEDWFMCPLCRGYYYISPAWFNLDVGNTRWIETTYWTGLQTKSDERKKLFSFKKCPLCENSMKKGGLKYVYICSCKNNVKMKPYIEKAEHELLSLCKKNRISAIGADEISQMNDFRTINAWLHLKKTSARGNVLKKLIYEYTSKDFFNVESADYKRDESKYQKRIFISSIDGDNDRESNDYVVNISSGSSDENNSNDAKMLNAKDL